MDKFPSNKMTFRKVNFVSAKKDCVQIEYETAISRWESIRFWSFEAFPINSQYHRRNKFISLRTKMWPVRWTIIYASQINSFPTNVPGTTMWKETVKVKIFNLNFECSCLPTIFGHNDQKALLIKNRISMNELKNS